MFGRGKLPIYNVLKKKKYKDYESLREDFINDLGSMLKRLYGQEINMEELVRHFIEISNITVKNNSSMIKNTSLESLPNLMNALENPEEVFGRNKDDNMIRQLDNLYKNLENENPRGVA